MKYLIPLLFLLSSCRMSTVYIRSNQFCSRITDNQQWSEPTDWKKSDTRIRIREPKFDFIGSILKIKGPVNLKLKLSKDGIDSTNENGVQSVRINAEDQHKNKCYVIFMKKENNSYMVVYYTNVNLLFDIHGTCMMVPTEKRKVRFEMLWPLI